jgi:hypothetical protein
MLMIMLNDNDNAGPFMEEAGTMHIWMGKGK